MIASPPHPHPLTTYSTTATSNTHLTTYPMNPFLGLSFRIKGHHQPPSPLFHCGLPTQDPNQGPCTSSSWQYVAILVFNLFCSRLHCSSLICAFSSLLFWFCIITCPHVLSPLDNKHDPRNDPHLAQLFFSAVKITSINLSKQSTLYININSSPPLHDNFITNSQSNTHNI